MFTRRYRTVLIAWVVFLGGVLSIGPTSEFWAGNPTGIRSATTVVFAAFAGVAWRTMRLAIKIRPGTVIVRNMWATRWVAINDVSRFERPKDRVFRGGIRVVKKNGRVISASAFGAMNRFESSERAIPEVAELNAWLDEQTSPERSHGELRPRSEPTFVTVWAWRAWLTAVWILAALSTALAVGNLVNPNG